MAEDDLPSVDEVDEDGPLVVARVNVALIQSASEALEKLRGRTGMKKVDIVNRAIQLYEFVDEQQRMGSAMIFRDKNGSYERVRFM